MTVALRVVLKAEKLADALVEMMAVWKVVLRAEWLVA